MLFYVFLQVSRRNTEVYICVTLRDSNAACRLERLAQVFPSYVYTHTSLYCTFVFYEVSSRSCRCYFKRFTML